MKHAMAATAASSITPANVSGSVASIPNNSPAIEPAKRETLRLE
jgi:hypothetical protein